MPLKPRPRSAEKDETPVAAEPVNVLQFYALYGISIGAILVIAGSFTEPMMLGVGVAHVVFGLFAILQFVKARPPTQTKYVALVITNAAVCGFGGTVAFNVFRESVPGGLLLGVIYVPVPIACIAKLASCQVRHLYFHPQDDMKTDDDFD